MAQVDKDHMIELRSASDARSTAESAEKDIQLKSVAYAINEASNTGLFQAVFQGVLLDEVREELESKGYTVANNWGPTHQQNRAIISWKE